MTGVDAVALAEAFLAAYPARSEDECRTLAAQCIGNEWWAHNEWCRANSAYSYRCRMAGTAFGEDPEPAWTLRHLLRPLWRDVP